MTIYDIAGRAVLKHAFAPVEGAGRISTSTFVAVSGSPGAIEASASCATAECGFISLSGGAWVRSPNLNITPSPTGAHYYAPFCFYIIGGEGEHTAAISIGGQPFDMHASFAGADERLKSLMGNYGRSAEAWAGAFLGGGGESFLNEKRREYLMERTRLEDMAGSWAGINAALAYFGYMGLGEVRPQYRGAGGVRTLKNGAGQVLTGDASLAIRSNFETGNFEGGVPEMEDAAFDFSEIAERAAALKAILNADFMPVGNRITDVLFEYAMYSGIFCGAGAGRASLAGFDSAQENGFEIHGIEGGGDAERISENMLEIENPAIIAGNGGFGAAGASAHPACPAYYAFAHGADMPLGDFGIMARFLRIECALFRVSMASAGIFVLAALRYGVYVPIYEKALGAGVHYIGIAEGGEFMAYAQFLGGSAAARKISAYREAKPVYVKLGISAKASKGAPVLMRRGLAYESTADYAGQDFRLPVPDAADASFDIGGYLGTAQEGYRAYRSSMDAPAVGATINQFGGVRISELSSVPIGEYEAYYEYLIFDAVGGLFGIRDFERHDWAYAQIGLTTLDVTGLGGAWARYSWHIAETENGMRLLAVSKAPSASNMCYFSIAPEYAGKIRPFADMPSVVRIESLSPYESGRLLLNIGGEVLFDEDTLVETAGDLYNALSPHCGCGVSNGKFFVRSKDKNIYISHPSFGARSEFYREGHCPDIALARAGAELKPATPVFAAIDDTENWRGASLKWILKNAYTGAVLSESACPVFRALLIQKGSYTLVAQIIPPNSTAIAEKEYKGAFFVK